MLLLRLRQLRIFFLLTIFRVVSVFVKKKAWVICERGNEARDNGYSFYRYMKSKHPEQKVYFLITKDSADYKKVQDDAVIHNSVKSYWVIATAEKIISAHYAAILPLPVGTKLFYLFKLYRNFYFLQHGVIKDDLKALYADIAPMRLFVCGAKPEYDDIQARYGHPKGVVRYTGLARFDYLYNTKTSNQILIMPTWRAYIKNDEEFLKSEFYVKWQQLLMDSNLTDVIERNNIKLLFYVHYEMQKYSKYFEVTSPNISIATFEEYDVQTLLKESKLLVTDYSSVFFDFAYMNKPMVFYQFDNYHYVKGYFDYNRDGFGGVYNRNAEVVDAISRYINNNFVVEKHYKTRTERFFPMRDNKNCERIYSAIIES